MIELYFSTVKILAQRPTHISAVATVLLITKTFTVKYYYRRLQRGYREKREKERERREKKKEKEKKKRACQPIMMIMRVNRIWLNGTQRIPAVTAWQVCIHGFLW